MREESLTIVFSTKNDTPEFIEHLRKTCGVKDAEILQYINNGKHSLTEIYNKALKEAKNNIIVFSHDDVIFEEADNWGKKIIQHFQNSDFGILGKAGTTSLTESGRWWDQPYLMVGEVWHQQTDQKTGQVVAWECKYSGNFRDKIIETILVDGLFFAVHRKRIKKEFDENIKGFHFYDIDFSFANYIEGVKVGVIFNMKITHKSIGMTDIEWESNRMKFVNKWKDLLPYSLSPQIMYEELNITLKKQPKVVIIIPTKDEIDLLTVCINSILEKTKYQNYKIYIADTGSTDENLHKIKNYIADQNVNIMLIEYKYSNFNRIVNDIVKNYIDPDTELLLFCHNNVQLLNDALSLCVHTYLNNKEEIGTLGIRLHFNDNSIQHAGILLFVDRNNYLRVTHKGLKSFYSYYPGIERDILGSTGAFIMVNKDLFISLGGFPENYKESFGDIEFNIRALIAGKINYFAGDAVAYYHEPQKDGDPEKIKKQNEDFQQLLSFIQQNLNNPNVIKHIKFY
jgi:glycosyltransferase involved in cell wall biosynthesis